jgi:hypothetical protein
MVVSPGPEPGRRPRQAIGARQNPEEAQSAELALGPRQKQKKAPGLEPGQAASPWPGLATGPEQKKAGLCEVVPRCGPKNS